MNRRLNLNLPVLSFAILLRILVGIHPHSGQDDHQGASSAPPPAAGGSKYGGDYEAQRHWMELAAHLPVGEWYFHDLEYWGLDYPPLTAYVSRAWGWGADRLGGLRADDGGLSGASVHGTCGDDQACLSQQTSSAKQARGLKVLKDLVALRTSRGFEHPIGKLYMRFTVLIMDLLIYISAVWAIVPRLIIAGDGNGSREKQRTRLWMTALLQPALVLVDHGHFQYNTVSLGLALWSFHFMTMHTDPFTNEKKEGESSSSSFVGPIVGSILFSLALNFKQMELYHAPAVFAYLLGRCFGSLDEQRDSRSESRSSTATSAIVRFCALGITVISTFAFLWFPFAIYPRTDDGSVAVAKLHLEGVAQLFKRLFPFQRGLFEGKVSNIWCALSIKPFSIRKRIPSNLLPWMALGLTLLLILPPCWMLFRVGRGNTTHDNASFNGNKTAKSKIQQSKQQNHTETNDLRNILWGSAATSLAFFLASFQVHEKGILIPLAPLSLLALDAPHFTTWFSVVAAWSLFPLLVVDRLREAYVCCIVIFLCLNAVIAPSSQANRSSDCGNVDAFSAQCATKYLRPLSWAAMALLHISELRIIPPSNLPDLFAVLWSFVGCGFFCFSYLVTIWAMANLSTASKRRGSKSSFKVGRKGSAPIISMVGVGLLFVLIPPSEGFVTYRNHAGVSLGLHASISDDANVFPLDMIERARVPLYWETQRVEDAKPILDLSARDPGALSLSEEASVNQNRTAGALIEGVSSSGGSGADLSDSQWADGCVWLETKQQLILMGVLRNETSASEQLKTKLITSETMLNRAPQLFRLPTSDVIESTEFFMTQDQFTLAPLIQLDPSVLTYCADDLHYGMEYLSNMMTRGNKTQAVQMIQMQCSIAPSMALSLFRIGVDGGIDERRISNALSGAAKASGKAVEMAVGDAGRSYREFKRLKGGKRSLS